MEIITLTVIQILNLAEKFNVDPTFVEEALYLTEMPELDAESEATNLREAEIEFFEATGCCQDDEKAAIRKWIDFAPDQSEVLRIYERITCDRADAERMYAIRKLSALLFNS
jgi:hypothetical protein